LLTREFTNYGRHLVAMVAIWSPWSPSDVSPEKEMSSQDQIIVGRYYLSCVVASVTGCFSCEITKLWSPYGRHGDRRHGRHGRHPTHRQKSKGQVKIK